MAYFPPTGSVVAYQGLPSSMLTGASLVGQLPSGTAVLGSIATLQGTNPWITTFSNSSILASPTGNQSVSGTVGASIIGHAPVIIIGGSVATATTNSSVQLLNSANIIGSVTTLQGTNPWIANIGGSVATVIIGGSVATATTNSSVMLLNSAAVIGSVATLQGTNPWIVNTSGSVAAVIIGGSVATATTNSSVMLLNSAGIIGSVTTLQGTNPWIINTSGSVAAVIIGGSVATATTNSSVMLLNSSAIIGSITALQGTNPWTTTFSNSSILTNQTTGTSSLYTVLSSISTISVMAALATRKAATILNTAGTALFIKLGTAATTSMYTVLMNPNDYYELPGGWTGVVAGISNSTAGVINVTELT